MSEDTKTTDRPKNDPEKKKERKDWTAFDLDLISAAKHSWVVDFFFMGEIPVSKNGSPLDAVTGTVLVVDRFNVKISIPADDGAQREVWIAKAVVAAAEVHKPARNS